MTQQEGLLGTRISINLVSKAIPALLPWETQQGWRRRAGRAGEGGRVCKRGRGREESLGEGNLESWCLGELSALFLFNALLQNTPGFYFDPHFRANLLMPVTAQGKNECAFPSSISSGDGRTLPKACSLRVRRGEIVGNPTQRVPGAQRTRGACWGAPEMGAGTPTREAWSPLALWPADPPRHLLLLVIPASDRQGLRDHSEVTTSLFPS